MFDSDVKKKYLKQIEILQQHNKLYYNTSNPIISDKEYDKLKHNNGSHEQWRVKQQPI